MLRNKAFIGQVPTKIHPTTCATKALNPVQLSFSIFELNMLSGAAMDTLEACKVYRPKVDLTGGWSANFSTSNLLLCSNVTL